VCSPARILKTTRALLFGRPALKMSCLGLLRDPVTVSGQYIVKDVKPTSKGELQKVKVKVKVNINGMFSVSSAQLTEKREATAQEQEAQEQEDAKRQEENAMDTNATDSQDNSDNHKADDTPSDEVPEKKETKKKGPKQITKMIDLPIETVEFGYTSAQLNDHIEEEVSRQSRECLL